MTNTTVLEHNVAQTRFILLALA